MQRHAPPLSLSLSGTPAMQLYIDEASRRRRGVFLLYKVCAHSTTRRGTWGPSPARLHCYSRVVPSAQRAADKLARVGAVHVGGGLCRKRPQIPTTHQNKLPLMHSKTKQQQTKLCALMHSSYCPPSLIFLSEFSFCNFPNVDNFELRFAFWWFTARRAAAHCEALKSPFDKSASIKHIAYIPTIYVYTHDPPLWRVSRRTYDSLLWERERSSCRQRGRSSRTCQISSVAINMYRSNSKYI